MKPSTHQNGFTMVELIVVIVILGILSATALPKFMSLEESAKESVIKATAGALESGLNLTRMAYLSTGDQNGACDVNGSTADVGPNGWILSTHWGSCNGAISALSTASWTDQHCIYSIRDGALDGSIPDGMAIRKVLDNSANYCGLGYESGSEGGWIRYDIANDNGDVSIQEGALPDNV